MRLGAITRAGILASPRSKRLAQSVVSPSLEAMGLRMRAMRADCEDQRRRKVVKKILSKGESTGRPFAAFGAERLSGRLPKFVDGFGHAAS